ncbi:hypothetical protein JMJ77_0010040, partial [Colletotrichum scovillei]
MLALGWKLVFAASSTCSSFRIDYIVLNVSRWILPGNQASILTADHNFNPEGLIC